MPKTIFVDGSILTPTFMDLAHGNSATTGHKHTGQNDDDSAPLIEPATEFNASVNVLVPNVNLQQSKVESVLVSFDGGGTFPFATSFQLRRIGDTVFARLITTIAGNVTVAGDILFEPSGGGLFDTNFWFDPANSSMCVGRNDTGVTDTRVSHTMGLFNTGTNHLTIYAGDAIGSSNWTGTVSVFAGNIYSWSK